MFEGRRLVMVLIPPAGPPVTLPLGWLLPGGLVSLDPGIQVYYLAFWTVYYKLRLGQFSEPDIDIMAS
jgi:hypothetical protein